MPAGGTLFDPTASRRACAAQRAGTLRLDGHTLDDIGDRRWRRSVSLSPQFHENHVMLGSLAYNLLLGRRWPPQPGGYAIVEADQPP